MVYGNPIDKNPQGFWSNCISRNTPCLDWRWQREDKVKEGCHTSKILLREWAVRATWLQTCATLQDKGKMTWRTVAQPEAEVPGTEVQGCGGLRGQNLEPQEWNGICLAYLELASGWLFLYSFPLLSFGMGILEADAFCSSFIDPSMETNFATGSVTRKSYLHLIWLM